MKENCECRHCKNQVDEYFCTNCQYGFNECESFYEIKENTELGRLAPGIQLCPKCHPKDSRNNNYIFIAKDGK